jgi:hypothetical protein
VTGLTETSPVWRDLQDAIKVAAGVPRAGIGELSERLYLDWYLSAQMSEPAVGPPNPVDCSPADALRAAHFDSETWSTGWTFHRPAGGDQVVVSCGASKRLVHRVDLLPDSRPCIPPRPGDKVSVVERRDFVQEDGSCWFSSSGNWDETKAETDMVRLYLNVALRHAPAVLTEVTRVLSQTVDGYSLKVWLAETGRSDGMVIYLRGADAAVAVRALGEVRHLVEPLLRPATPRFALRLGDGFALAEDPGEEESFGQNRCRLVAEALLRHQDSDRSVLALADYLVLAGLDLKRPYTNRGTCRRYEGEPQ